MPYFSNYHCKILKFLISVGDTYSCFSGFQSVVTEGCKSRVVDDEGSIVQATLSDVENTDFCVSGPSYGQAKQGLLSTEVLFHSVVFCLISFAWLFPSIFKTTTVHNTMIR